MKTKSILAGVAACLIAGSFTACNKSSPENSPGTNAVTAEATQTNGMAATMADTAKDVVGQAVATATNAVTAATSQFDAAVAKVKQAITDKNYQGALDLLNQASKLATTPEQQQTLSDLKAQVQKLLAGGTGAVDAAKGLLGK